MSDRLLTGTCVTPRQPQIQKSHLNVDVIFLSCINDLVPLQHRPPPPATSMNFSLPLYLLMKPQASGEELQTAGRGPQKGLAESQVRLWRPSPSFYGGNVSRLDLGGSWVVTAALMKMVSLLFPEPSITLHCFHTPGITKAPPHLAIGRVK